MSERKKGFSRRKFIGTTGLGVAGLMLGTSAKSFGAIKGANESLNVGLIGPGSQGTTLLRSLITVPNVKVTALCDIFEPNLSKAVKLVGGEPKTYQDYRKLLENKDLDAVAIAVPLHMHFEIAQAALQAGRNVYLEKTMCYSIEQCDKLVQLKNAHPSQRLQVGYQRHYLPVVKKAIEMSKDGALGQVTDIRCMWHRNGSWRRPVPKSDFDPRPYGYPDLEHLINWRMYKTYSGGLMAELGSHMMQIVNLIYGKMPAAVTGFGGIDFYKDGRDTYDDVSVIYKYPEGQRAIFTSLTTNAHDGERIQIMGTEGTLNFGWSDALYYREKEAGTQTKEEGATVIGSTGETMKTTTGGDQKGTKVDTPQSAQDRRRMDAGYLAMESFINCVRDGKNPEVDVNEGRKSAICILKANQAMEEGKVMKF